MSNTDTMLDTLPCEPPSGGLCKRTRTRTRKFLVRSFLNGAVVCAMLDIAHEHESRELIQSTVYGFVCGVLFGATFLATLLLYVVV